MRRVAVTFGDSPGWAYLRALRGDDEESIAGTDSEAAIALLDRLLVDGAGAVVRTGDAASLALPDRDRLLAAIQIGELTSKIESPVTCVDCGTVFELGADLAALLESLDAHAHGHDVVADDPGVFRLPDGRRFRLPCGSDERAVAGLPPERAQDELLARCMIEGSAEADPATVGDMMRDVGPLIDVEIGGACVDCGAQQTARFDIQHYLLAGLIGEDRRRAGEIHEIALAYRWSLAEILSLPRSRRRMHANLIAGGPAGW